MGDGCWVLMNGFAGDGVRILIIIKYLSSKAINGVVVILNLLSL